MNERIRELKQQARDFYLLQEDLDCSIKQLHELVEAKFAELIVRHCALTAGLMEHQGRTGIGAQLLDNFEIKD